PAGWRVGACSSGSERGDVHRWSRIGERLSGKTGTDGREIRPEQIRRRQRWEVIPNWGRGQVSIRWVDRVHRTGGRGGEGERIPDGAERDRSRTRRAPIGEAERGGGERG